MKKFIMAALSLFFFTQCALGFSACNAGKEHEHVFEEEWRHNAQSHWHFCTVPGCNERGSEEAHTDWELIETIEQPSCFERGEGKYKCSVCGEIKQDYIEPTGEHVWSEWKPAEEYHYKVCTKQSRGCVAEIREDHVPGGKILKSVPEKYKDGVETISCTVCKQKLQDFITPATMVAHTFKLTVLSVSRPQEAKEPFFYFSEVDDNWHITVMSTYLTNDYFYKYEYSDGLTAGNDETPPQATDIFDYNTGKNAGIIVDMVNMRDDSKVTLLSDAEHPEINDYASCFRNRFRFKKTGHFKLIFYFAYKAYNGLKETTRIEFIADAYSYDDYNAWFDKWNSESHEGTEITTVLTATPST